jgi:hypothetical protein
MEAEISLVAHREHHLGAPLLENEMGGWAQSWGNDKSDVR